MSANGIHVPSNIKQLCDCTAVMFQLDEVKKEILLITLIAAAKIGGEMSKVDHERMVGELKDITLTIAAMHGMNIKL